MEDLPQSQVGVLKSKIENLKIELQGIRNKVYEFEQFLRQHLVNEIIEVQELTVLYKRLKKEKKEKRFKGKKNFEEGGVVRLKQVSEKQVLNDDQKERKRLYREAMVKVHPDKFALKNDEVDLATELTTQLIAIYENGSLEELEAFHAALFSGSTLLEVKTKEGAIVAVDELKFYEKELASLLTELELIKSNELYKVLMEYENPKDFLNELKVFYADRLFKLRKRTRKA